MVDILKAILDFVVQYLTFEGIAVLFLVCALIYIWFQHHRAKILKERLNLAEERRSTLRDELEKVSHRPLKKGAKLNAKESVREVLIADDEATMREFLTKYISREIPNVSVVSANDGEETLQHIARHSPSLLILDLMMPRKTGFDVLSEVARSNQKFPIIIISAYFSSKDEIAEKGGIESDRILVFPKPFDFLQILEKVKDLLASADV